MSTVEIENPLRAGLRLERTSEPCSVIIFGASGDLTMRKLIPALFSLAQQNLMPATYSIIGAARTDMTHDDFRAKMRDAVNEFADVGSGDDELVDSFVNSLYYNPSDPTKPETMENLRKLLEDLDGEKGTSGNRLFYLSTPPSLYAPICKGLGGVGLSKSEGWTRIIIEKPFGRDLDSMLQLNKDVLEDWDEDQVYRIDHYLGKETVQNILVLRFANAIFEPLWSREYVDHVQITASESLGVEKRGGYYEQAGAIRDMLQNHLFQVFGNMAMEPPVGLAPNDVRDEKTKLIRSVRQFTVDQVPEFALRGQYGAGSINGKPVPGYRTEEQVDPNSSTDTYASVKLLVDNWRWAGVPFYLRSAKRMPKRISEVAIQFRKAPHLIFQGSGGAPVEPNSLIIRVQPDEGITLKFRAKLPGQSIDIRNVNMDFSYGTSFGKKSPEAYERLILDAMLGDSTLFARGDFVETSWQIVMPVLEAWSKPAGDTFPNYAAGSWGPDEADEWLGEGRKWRRP